MVTGLQIPSLPDMLSEAQGTVWVISLQLWSFWMEIILLNVYCDYIQRRWAHLEELECKPLSWVAAITYCVCQQIIDNDTSSVTASPSRLWIELSWCGTIFLSTIQVIILFYWTADVGSYERRGTGLARVFGSVTRRAGKGPVTQWLRWRRFGTAEPAARHVSLSAALRQRRFAQTKIGSNMGTVWLTLSRCLGKAPVTCSGAHVAPAMGSGFPPCFRGWEV